MVEVIPEPAFVAAPSAAITDLIAALEGLMASHLALRSAYEHRDSVVAALAPEGADDWMFNESVRPRIAEAIDAITPAVLADMEAETEAYRAIAEALAGQPS